MKKSLALMSVLFAVTGATVTVLGIVDDSKAENPSTEARVQVVMSEPLDNAPGSNVTAVLVDYGPGGRSPSHHHGGSVFAYVLQGAVRSQNSATGPERVYHAGESFFEPAGSIHLVSANASKREPARMLAVFVAPADARLTTAEH